MMPGSDGFTLCRKIRNQENLLRACKNILSNAIEHTDRENGIDVQICFIHSKKHQGLGLAIAKRFLEEQGGMLKFGNHDVRGAQVDCFIKL